MAYSTETEKYAQESQQYLDDVHRAKTSGRFDKYITLRDPLAERYSQVAEDRRQLKTIIDHDRQAARGSGNVQDASGAIEFSQDELTPGQGAIDFSGDLSGDSTGKSAWDVYQSHRPDWNAPPKTGEHPVAGEAARVLNALSPVTNMLQEVAAPLETVGDYFRGLISPQTVLPGIGREGSYAGPLTPRELNPSIDEAYQTGDPATGIIRELATGLGTNPAYLATSPLLRRPQIPAPVTPTELKVLSAEEMLGGRPTEIPRISITPQTPEAIPYGSTPVQPLQYEARPTGRFILPGGQAPSITDLAQAHQAQVLEGARTGAFYGPEEALPLQRTEFHESRPAPTPSAVDLVSGKAALDRSREQYTTVFEKPRALRTAEEILQERQTMPSKLLHGRQDQQVREALAYVPIGSSETASAGAAEGATKAMELLNKRDLAKANRLQAQREEDILEFATEYIAEGKAKQREELTAPVYVAGNQLPKTFDHLSADSMFPSVQNRMVGDVLTVIGRYSPAWQGAAESIRKTYEISSIQASQSLMDYTAHVTELFGKRPWFQRTSMAYKGLTEGENIAIAKSQRAFNLDADVEEAAFNYLYTNGKMQPPLSMPAAKREQAIKFAEMTYKDMLLPTSSHSGVRQIPIHDPFTGETFAPGEPSMFVAHQPITEISRKALTGQQWELLYNRMGGAEKTKGNLESFITRVINFSKREPELGAQVFNMPNLEQKRLVDLSALGGSPYQHAKKLGYETDLFAMAVRYRTNGVLRGELQLLKPGIDALKAAPTGLSHEGALWLEKALNYAMKVPHGAEQVQPYGTNVLLAGRRWIDMALLGKASLTNMAQFAYPLARVMGTPVIGAKAGMKGILDYVFGNNPEMIRETGALMPATLNEFSHPTGPLAVLHSNVMNMYALPWIDKNTRLFAGHIGNRYVTALSDYFLANPTSKTHAKILDEMGGPGAAKTILTEGKVNDNLRLEMIQRFANNTAGILDARGLPWYATSENPYAKVVLQYRPYLIANSAEIHRSIANAPTKAVAATRFATLLVGGAASATAIYEAKQLFNHLIQGPDYKAPNRDTAYIVENIIAGFGGAYTATAMDFVTNPMRSGLGGAVPLAGYVAGLGEDLKSSVKHGPGWRSLRTASELPIIGTVTGPYVHGKAQAEAQALREAGE